LGGSITSGVLALSWKHLNFQNSVATNFAEKIVKPLREFCERSIDTWAIGEGAFLPWKSISDSVQEEYEEHLFAKATLQDLPDNPRFVFNLNPARNVAHDRPNKPPQAGFPSVVA